MIHVFFQRYLKYHIHVSVAIVCLFATTAYFMDSPIVLIDYWGVGCCSALGYLYITKLSEKPTLLLGLIYAIGTLFAIWYGFQLNIFGRICCVLSGMLVILYPNFERLRFIGLREQPGLKVFIVALTWTIFCVGISYSRLAQTITPILLVQVCCFVWAYVLAAMVPFEIRDVLMDDPKLKTLAHSFGISGIKLWGYFWILVAGVAVGFMPMGLQSKLWILIQLKILFWCIYASPSRIPHFYEFWVEAIPIGMFLGILVFGS